MALTIELWLKSDKQVADGSHSILMIYDINSCDRFIVEQYKSLLIVSYRNKKIETRKKREIGIDNIINKNEALFLTISLGPKGLKLYLDGILLGNYNCYVLNKQINQALGKLVLGATPSGHNPWVGEIYGVGIYSDTLSAQHIHKNIDLWKNKKFTELIDLNNSIAIYTFNEGNGKYIYNIADDSSPLLIPADFHILNKEILKIPERNSGISISYFLDIFMNILGFVPYSFLICYYFQMRQKILFKHHYIIIIIFCSLLSLFIEVTQTSMPQRDSSLFDLFLNITGGMLGTTIFHFKKF